MSPPAAQCTLAAPNAIEGDGDSFVRVAACVTHAAFHIEGDVSLARRGHSNVSPAAHTPSPAKQQQAFATPAAARRPPSDGVDHLIGRHVLQNRRVRCPDRHP
ncbi:hypothetical protein DENSPDRAFT_846399 [Dentipellis sp. KUC8613]|nr:hypothetical protein DENSPDRAFT_846399 [Dentipellis sp. KUC8613]